MSEAWREVARLGKAVNSYPHVLADSRGWCLRLGPQKRSDEKYYSSVQSLILGLLENYLRRRLGASQEIRTLIQFVDLVLLHLKEASALGAELERKLIAPAPLGLLARPEGRPSVSKPGEPGPAPEIAAGAAEMGSEAA